MNNSPPEGSKIIVDSLDGFQRILIPHGSDSILRYLIGAFFIFWMGGWIKGFSSASSLILSGKGGAFIIFWLGAWSVGGLLSGYTILRFIEFSRNPFLKNCFLICHHFH